MVVERSRRWLSGVETTATKSHFINQQSKIGNQKSAVENNKSLYSIYLRSMIDDLRFKIWLDLGDLKNHQYTPFLVEKTCISFYSSCKHK
jgi:hypothetical protein